MTKDKYNCKLSVHTRDIKLALKVDVLAVGISDAFIKAIDQWVAHCDSSVISPTQVVITKFSPYMEAQKNES